MNTFPMRTEADQLALGVAELVERLVETVASAEPDWAGLVGRFEELMSLHRHTGILRGRGPASIILWKTGLLLVRKLEASTASPSLWNRAAKPLEALSADMGIDLHHEFASLGSKEGQ